MIKLKSLLNEDWPKWRANADAGMAFKLAAGDDMNDIPSWFEEAGKTFDALETEMNSAGHVKEPKDSGQYMDWEKWLQTTGLGKVVNAMAAQDYSEEPDSAFSMWNKNVVANKKSATWKTKDGTMLIHANTFESFNNWLDTGKPGLMIRICSSTSNNPAGSCNKEYPWNIGNPIITK
jgi:hypothetical protein